MSLFIEILIGVIVAVALVSVTVVVVKAKHAGQPIPWDKVRPIVTDAFNEVQSLITANKMGYQDVEDYVVSFVLNRVDTSDVINSTEKAILSEGLIRSIIAPSLKELHNKTTQAPVAAPVAPAAPVQK